MRQLELSQSYYAEGDGAGTFQSGQVYHVIRNVEGGSWNTPIARFFISTPLLSPEGYHPHQRLDCFVRNHELSPPPEWLGRVLADALVSSGSLVEPFWVSWHMADELDGEERGQVFDYE
jgi:hypothetical protein